MRIIGIKKEYLLPILIFGFLPFILLLFPFININESSEHLLGFQFLNKIMQEISDKGLSMSYLIIVAIMLIIPSIILVASIISFLRPGKKILYFMIGMYSLEVFGFVVSLLSFKATVDAAKFFEVGFLVKYLSMGYWLPFLLVPIGLILTMKSVKVSPGYIVLTVMAAIWLFPTTWLIISSLRSEGGYYIGYLIPKKFTFNNYIDIWTDTSHWQFARWFRNTTIVAVCNMIISTLLVLATSYVMSRIRFKARGKLMSFFLIVGMFPGFMSMIAVYYILKVFGLNNSLAALVIIYSSGAGLGYYVAKGFFDTISKTLDEAAYIDGATKWQVFIKIIMPLSKPIIVFTILGAFMAPWGDFMMPRIILGTNIDNYTVSVGLYSMLVKEEINGAWKMFCAGAVCIAIPISVIFLYLQKFYVDGLSGSVKG